jgi:hypothetical protein
VSYGYSFEDLLALLHGHARAKVDAVARHRRRVEHGRLSVGVRRGKAALSSGCKSHPATAPAGSNRSSHGGDEVAEASG